MSVVEMEMIDEVSEVTRGAETGWHCTMIVSVGATRVSAGRSDSIA